MKILYLSNSYINSKEANFIQIDSMIKAFISIDCQVHVIYKSNRNFIQTNKFQKIIEIYSGKLRFSNLYFTFKAVLKLRKLLLLDNYDLVYTRNILMSFLASFFFRNIILELHSYPENLLKELMLKFISKNTLIITISSALKLVLSNKLALIDISVLPDGHSFPIEKKYDCQIKSNGRLKIGYFGKLNLQKGLLIINNIIKSNQEVDFYIFSKDLNILPMHQNIMEYRYLEYDEVYNNMIRMDGLLLTIQATNTKRDISPYTSPLKLFEYLSTGIPIIAIKYPVFEEILNESNCIFFNGSADDFKLKIQKLKDHKYINNISVNAQNCARNYTWEKRALRILEIVKNKYV